MVRRARKQEMITIQRMPHNRDFIALSADGPRAVFSAKDRKLLWKMAMIDAMTYWLKGYLPLRFENYVRRAPWNYSYGRKDEDPRPLRSSGRAREEALASAGVRVTSTGKGAVGKVAFNVPAYVDRNKHVPMRGVLETVSRDEAERVARRLTDAWAEMANEGKKKVTRKGRERRVLE